MQDFIDKVAAAADLDPSLTPAAMGYLLLFLRDKAPQSRIADYIESTPRAREAAISASGLRDAGLAWLVEELTLFGKQGRADLNVLVGRLLMLGLDHEQIEKLLDETLARADSLIGADAVCEIRSMLPASTGGATRESADPAANLPADNVQQLRPSQIANVASTLSPQRGDAAEESRKYLVRETVGVFDDEDTLETAVDELEAAGFDRAAVSVLAGVSGEKGETSRVFRAVEDVEDNGAAQQSDFVSSHSRAEGAAALIGAPLYIGGAAGMWAVMAAGGSLALAVASTIAFGGLGAGLGAILAGALHRGHRRRIEEQLKIGGLVLWVTTPDSASEQRAMAVFNELGARDVHVHEIQREWSFKSIPLAGGPFDPFVNLLGSSPPLKRSA